MWLGQFWTIHGVPESNMNLINMKKKSFSITLSLFLVLASSLFAEQKNVQKRELWFKCFNKKEICARIYLERDLTGEKDQPVASFIAESIPPTILEDEDVSITVDVTSTAVVSEGEDLRGNLQPIEIVPLKSQPLIEKEKVSEKKLEELIGDTAVIQRLLDDRPVDKLAITIIRQDFEVTAKMISGQTLFTQVVPIQMASAEEAKDKQPDYPGCAVPEDAVFDADEPNVAYTVPGDKMVFRDKSDYYRGGGYWVGPNISYYDEEGKKMRSRVCYNRYSELDGVATLWFENGKMEKQSEYKNGKLHGTQTEWYKNGQKKYEKHFKDGEKDGGFTKWFEDGHKYYVEQYKNGKLDGLSSYWGESKPGGDNRVGFRGIKTRDDYYHNGELVKRIGYRYEGWKAEESHFKNGKRHGTTTYLRKNGGVSIITNYVNGKEHGVEKSYDKDGKLCGQKQYRNGEIIKWDSFGDCR
jgi:antitoxin component YwqK of YwqJK toxin-antitoxin module